ncbi:hypothetical protein E2C01_051693 [Portunus trituberculatus]|uniref:Uncharacterized protein n=1 Tax=Portunus trituberculatus TaxID=210409 RepID=A0A5B7GJF4_PORTR|nr:hypothetical protein [Portunus trituberculatus]
MQPSKQNKHDNTATHTYVTSYTRQHIALNTQHRNINIVISSSGLLHTKASPQHFRLTLVVFSSGFSLLFYEANVVQS